MKEIVHFAVELMKHFEKDDRDYIAQEIARFTFNFLGEDAVEKLEKELKDEKPINN